MTNLARAVATHLERLERVVLVSQRNDKPARAIRLSYTFPTTHEDLWDAITSIERIPRWFSPISGELKLGGRYALEHNAHGEITACDPPSSLAITWEFGDDISWVDARVGDTSTNSSRLELTHTSCLSNHWEQ